MPSRTSRVTMHHLIRPTTPLSTEPDLEPVHPWRFRLGQDVYIAGRPQNTTFEVVGGLLHRGFPHLLVRDLLGSTHRIPQLAASSIPIRSK